MALQDSLLTKLKELKYNAAKSVVHTKERETIETKGKEVDPSEMHGSGRA